MADELNNLPPEERIKKLKELEKQKRKEIEEAQKKIRESEDELKEKIKWHEKVPIPEFAQEHLTDLSPEAKEILHRGRGLNEIKVKSDSAVDSKKNKPSESLEETLWREKSLEVPREILEADYTRHLSQKPVQNLYQEMAKIKADVEDKGHMSRDDERRVEYMMGAVERKQEEGYSFTEETARAASITQQMGAQLRNIYRSKQNDLYNSE